MSAPAWFASPTDALAAVLECLAPLCELQHTGSFGSGESLTLDQICPCLLRVESAGLRSPEFGPIPVNKVRGRCESMTLDIAVTYAACFETSTKQGKSIGNIRLTEQGLDMIDSWWRALGLLACCAGGGVQAGTNAKVKVVSVAERPPDGGIAGWTMMLETTVSVCACEEAVS